MKSSTNKTFDLIVVGAGMGGLTAASLLANDGYSVLVLEAAHV
ncbi:MAG: NAD(P)-binding protein, partial [Balneolaceae bacterium]|nr:NAD(P)-binding protein [Balneolaceae bacterium]